MSVYPDSSDLRRITRWKPKGHWVGTAPWLPILDLCEAAWNADMGVVRLNGSVHTFVTGGWSGNEEIIGALMKNRTAWTMLWLASYGGGKYELGMDEDDVRAAPQPQKESMCATIAHILADPVITIKRKDEK